jgi:hypothetical protein
VLSRQGIYNAYFRGQEAVIKLIERHLGGVFEWRQVSTRSFNLPSSNPP